MAMPLTAAATSGASPTGTPHGSLARRVTGLLDEVIAYHFHPDEDASSLSAGLYATRGVLRFVDRTVSVLRATNLRFRPHVGRETTPEGQVAEPSLEDIGAMISSEVAARDIADLSAMAAGELYFQGRQIESAIAGGDRIRAVTGAEDVLRELVRILIPLEASLHEFWGMLSPRRVWPDLQVSLQVRRAFAALARGVSAIPRPSEDGLEAALLQLADLLLDLRRNPIYLSVRIEDRLNLGRLSQRLAAWLAQPEHLGTVEGYGVLADVRAYVCLLRQVNWRSELRQHDHQLAKRWVDRLSGSGEPEIPPIAFAELGALVGRDDEVDALILAGSRTTADWIAALWRLVGSLDS